MTNHDKDASYHFMGRTNNKRDNFVGTALYFLLLNIHKTGKFEVCNIKEDKRLKDKLRN